MLLHRKKSVVHLCSKCSIYTLCCVRKLQEGNAEREVGSNRPSANLISETSELISTKFGVRKSTLNAVGRL